jgi:hypothetical protein
MLTRRLAPLTLALAPAAGADRAVDAGTYRDRGTVEERP